MSTDNKQGISQLPLLALSTLPPPRMWRKRLQITLTDESLKMIGVAEAPTGKLALYICQHAKGMRNWFVTIEGDSSGISLSQDDVGRIKACRIGTTLHVQGNAIASKEIRMVIYAL